MADLNDVIKGLIETDASIINKVNTVDDSVSALENSMIEIEDVGEVNEAGLPFATKKDLESMTTKINETESTLASFDVRLNELFQNANNGKQLIANAIGEPVNADDTFSAMSNDINNLLNTFKTNMMNNGVTIESGDKFKQLIDKIKGLTEGGGNKGVQFIEGEINGTIPAPTYRDGSYSSVLDITFSEALDFTPTLFLVSFSNFSPVYSSNNNFFRTSNIVLNSSLSPFDFNLSNLAFKLYIENVSNTGFTVRFHLAGSTGLTSLGMTVNKFYAIGVDEGGGEDSALRDSLASILQDEGVSVPSTDTMSDLIIKVDTEFDRQVIPSGTAVVEDVRSGKTFINSSGLVLTGTATVGTSTFTKKTISNSSASNLGQDISSSKYLSVNHNLGFTPTHLLVQVSITQASWPDSMGGYPINASNIIVFSGLHNSATNALTITVIDEYGENFSLYYEFWITNITSTSFRLNYTADWWDYLENTQNPKITVRSVYGM